MVKETLIPTPPPKKPKTTTKLPTSELLSTKHNIALPLEEEMYNISSHWIELKEIFKSISGTL